MNRYRLVFQSAGDRPFPDVAMCEALRYFSRSDEWLRLLEFRPDFIAQPDILMPGDCAEFLVASDLDRAALKNNLASGLRGIKGITKVTVVGAISADNDFAKSAPSNREMEPRVLSTAMDTVEKRHQANNIRIGLDKVEELVNLIGELLISKSQVEELSRRSQETGKNNKLTTVDWTAALNQLGQISGKLRDISLSIRMVPVKNILSKFPVMVRDIARAQGKKIEFVTQGGETEVDKVILEALHDPILHILRNALDHGLETPAERAQAGKAETGQIFIKAEYEGDIIKIIVEDDGRGIDPGAIAGDAIAKGLISPQTARDMSARDALNLVFLPGFSTKREVGALSGRGVGMDVVKTNIGAISGGVEIESAAGVGTRVTLKIPLTLSILESLLIRDSGEIFAVPLIAIYRITRIRHESIKRVGRYMLAQLDDYSVPVFPLAEIFGAANSAVNGDFFLIETALNDGRFGIIAEEIIGRREIVIKSLGGFLGKVRGISGGTILSDGRVALIIDIKSYAGAAQIRLDDAEVCA